MPNKAINRSDGLRVSSIPRSIAAARLPLSLRLPHLSPLPGEGYFLHTATHTVFSREHRMLLVLDDRLGEIQPLLLQERWVVRTVRVPAPDVEPPARDQHAGDVAEPGVEQAIELLVRHEVVGQRAVLGSQLLLRRLRFLRMPGHVHRLAMRRLLER